MSKYHFKTQTQQEEQEVKPLTIEQKKRVINRYNHLRCFILCIIEMLKKDVEMLTTDAYASTLNNKRQQHMYRKFNIFVSTIYEAVKTLKHHNKPLQEIHEAFRTLECKWSFDWISMSRHSCSVAVNLSYDGVQSNSVEKDVQMLASMSTNSLVESSLDNSHLDLHLNYLAKDKDDMVIWLNNLFMLLDSIQTEQEELLN